MTVPVGGVTRIVIASGGIGYAHNACGYDSR